MQAPVTGTVPPGYPPSEGSSVLLYPPVNLDLNPTLYCLLTLWGYLMTQSLHRLAPLPRCSPASLLQWWLYWWQNWS
jgi:hypothetical protein